MIETKLLSVRVVENPCLEDLVLSRLSTRTRSTGLNLVYTTMILELGT